MIVIQLYKGMISDISVIFGLVHKLQDLVFETLVRILWLERAGYLVTVGVIQAEFITRDVLHTVQGAL